MNDSSPAGRSRPPSSTSRRPASPLARRHVALGARLIEFGGWEMPVQYASIIDEHRTVRSAVGLFDLSHMGELHLSGPEAARLRSLRGGQRPAALEPGQAQYSMLCAPTAGSSTT